VPLTSLTGTTMSWLTRSFHMPLNSHHAQGKPPFLQCEQRHLIISLTKNQRPQTRRLIMTTLMRSALAAVALIGTVAAVSAAPHYDHQRYSDSDTFRSGVIADFNSAAHIQN
jgi:hypothetical protein